MKVRSIGLIALALVASTLVGVPAGATGGELAEGSRVDADYEFVEVRELPEQVAGVTDLAAGPDGNMWVTHAGSQTISKISPEGDVTTFEAVGAPRQIVAGHDGTMWFANDAPSAGVLGQITPDGVVTKYLQDPPMFSPYPMLDALELAPDGNFWIGDLDVYGGLFEVTPDEVLAWYGPSFASDVGNQIKASPDGNVWFTDVWGSIGRITPEGAEVGYPYDGTTDIDTRIEVGADGNLWYTAFDSIARLTPAGDVTLFSEPWIEGAYDIALGPDGNLWFTADGAIGRITHDGVLTKFEHPLIGSDPVRVEAGPDGNVWFTRRDGSDTSIGVIVLSQPDPTVTIQSTSVLEGDEGTTEMVFPVSLSAPSTQTVTVDWATSSDAQPEAGVDYEAASGTVTFPPGVTEASISVTVYGDTVPEPGQLWGAEWMAVTLSNPTHAQLLDGLGAVAFGLIVDDDPTTTVSIGDTWVLEGDSGTTELVFPVWLSEPSAETVSVDWSTTGIDAEPGVDYEEASGTVTFPPGVTEASISVTVYGDTVAEPGVSWGSEWMYVKLSNPSNAVVASGWDGIGFGLIRDDD